MTILAVLADLYTPLMMVLAMRVSIRRWRHCIWPMAIGLMGAIVLLTIEQALGPWQRLAMDFSGHTVWALFSCAWLMAFRSRWWPGIALSLVSYGTLMWQLGYHSWGDMITTSLAYSPFLWIGWWRRQRFVD